MSLEPGLVVVRTGTANTASVLAGFRRIGASPVLTEDADDVRRAAQVVLPGVGAFGAAMQHLARCGLVEALAERVHAGHPTLAICLGMQILSASSQESPGIAGLSVLEERVERLPDGVRVPQLGWNRVEADAGCAFLRTGYAYFANSYRLVQAPLGWRAAWTEHGDRWVAALERGAVLACQFHPELSGTWGLELLRRWMAELAPVAAEHERAHGSGHRSC